jgi:hypothetical protein
VSAAACPVKAAAVPDVAAEVLAAAHPVRVAVAPDVPADGLEAAAHRVRAAAAPDVPADGLEAAHPARPWVPPAAAPLAVSVADPAVAAAASSPSPVRFAVPARRRRPRRAARRARNPT